MTISEFKEFLPQIKNCPFENLDELFEEDGMPLCRNYLHFLKQLAS